MRAALRRAGYDVIRPVPPAGHPIDCPPEIAEVIDRVGPFTLTSDERIMALVAATEHLVRAGVPGAFVECGVWRGGSAMVMALTLVRLGVTDRDLVLFDTYTDMPDPGPEDIDLFGVPAADFIEEARAADAFRYATFDAVQEAVASTGYPMERVRFVPGLVEDTIPGAAPEEIALCRLDTDWYRSTAHEMAHLWPRISRGGVLLVDDYGHFQGAKQAVDEYFADQGLEVLLHRIDFSGRLAVKS